MMIGKIGRYKIIAELGKGAMGIVYKGFDEVIQRHVAIKMIYLKKTFDEKQLQEIKKRFYQESQAAGKLSHTNIVTIYDVGEHEGQPFIAMEYVDGESLAEKIKRSKVGLPWKSVKKIFYQVALGLDYAHSRGIIHRDIKPANILISKDNQAKIADFGIAKVSFSKLTRTGIVLGTPSYLSPEQIKDTKIDNRSDIFSLGATLYQAATGAKPFTGKNITEVMNKIVHYDPPIITLFPQVIPAKLEDVIKKALQKDPDKRYQSSSQLAVDLKKIRPRDIKKKSETGVTSATVPLAELEIMRGLADSKNIFKIIKKWYSKFNYKLSRLKFAFLKFIEDKQIKAKLSRVKKSSWLLLAAIGFLLLLASISAIVLFRDRPSKDTDMKGESEVSAKIEENAIDLSLFLESKSSAAELQGSKTDSKELRLIPASDAGNPNTVTLKKEVGINSNPPGASIIIDNEDSGLLTPSILQIETIKRSEHTITLIKDCYDNADRQLRFNDDSKLSLTFDLEQKTNIIKIDSKPTGAKIKINGKDTDGLTPASLRAGCGESYKLTLVKEGYKPFSTDLDTELNDKELTYALEIEDLLWEFTIKSNPTGANIFRNNVNTHLVTPASLQIKGFRGEEIIITLRKKDYNSISKTIKLQKDSKADLQFNLTPLMKKVLIESSPSGAEVFLDGQKMPGLTPVQIQLTGSKSYTIKLLKRGYYSKELTLNAEAAKQKMIVNLNKLPAPGKIVITAPYKANAYIEGKLISSIDKQGVIELQAGSYKIQLISREFFLDQTYPVTIKSGEEVIIYSPPLGRLSIKAEPSSCKIYVDGQLLGFPPIFEQTIVVGEHLVKFEWERFNIVKEERINVKKDQVSYVYKKME